MQREEHFSINMDEVVRRYADMVYRLAVVNTKDKTAADDIFQEVFLKLLRYQDSIKSEEHLKAWLIRVTINQCKSHVTSIWNKRKVSMDSVAEEAGEEKKDFSDVTEAVQELPEKYRGPIHLFYYEELSIKEIAGALGRNEATVKTQLARGRQLLNEKLKGEYQL